MYCRHALITERRKSALSNQALTAFLPLAEWYILSLFCSLYKTPHQMDGRNRSVRVKLYRG